MPGTHNPAAAKMNHSAPAKKYKKAAPKMKHSSPTEMNHAAPTKNLKKGYHGVKPNPPANMGSAYKMKNSVLHMGAKHGTPIHANYGSPAKMPDFSGDGKITQKDVLMGRGVIPKTNESPADMGHSSPADMYGASPNKKNGKFSKNYDAIGNKELDTKDTKHVDNVFLTAKQRGNMPGEGDATVYKSDYNTGQIRIQNFKKDESSNVPPNTYTSIDGGSKSFSFGKDGFKKSKNKS